MVTTLVRSLTSCFARMAELLTTQAGTAQASNCWKFVQEVHDCLSELPAAAVGRLRSWVGKDDDELAPAVERFMLAAIRAASSTAAAIGGDLTNLRWICRRHFKLLLPEPMICRIVTVAVAADSFIDSAGQTRHWLQWAYSGGPNLSVLWEVYVLLRRLAAESAAATAEAAAAGLLPPEVSALPRGLPETVERSFALAFVDEVYRDPASAANWEALLNE
ncbi:unnamed protein product, partial [Polarella glacialis]